MNRTHTRLHAMRDAHTTQLYELGTDQQWGTGRREASVEVDRQLHPLQEANWRGMQERVSWALSKS